MRIGARSFGSGVAPIPVKLLPKGMFDLPASGLRRRQLAWSTARERGEEADRNTNFRIGLCMDS